MGTSWGWSGGVVDSDMVSGDKADRSYIAVRMGGLGRGVTPLPWPDSDRAVTK